MKSLKCPLPSNFVKLLLFIILQIFFWLTVVTSVKISSSFASGDIFLNNFSLIIPKYGTKLPPLNNPLDTYINFRESLLGGRIDEALNYIHGSRRQGYKQSFNNSETLKLYLDIPEYDKLEHRMNDRNNWSVEYTYPKERKGEIPYTVTFELNRVTGFWEISGI